MNRGEQNLFPGFCSINDEDYNIKAERFRLGERV